MLKIDLSDVVTGLDGQPIKDAPEGVLTYGKVLAARLVASSENSLKYYDWASSLFLTGAITCDEADMNLLKLFVENSRELTNLVKAPILRAINSADRV